MKRTENEVSDNVKQRKRVNIKLISVCVCVPTFLLHFVQNGLVVTTVSTIQNRYQLQSTEIGLITGMENIVQVAFYVVLFIIGDQLQKPIWIGCGSILIGIGSIVFTVPQFVSPPYDYKAEELNNFCGNVSTPECEETFLRQYRFVFMAGMAILGIGTAILFSFGITYIDENTSKQDSAWYTSIVYLMMAVGPIVGFLVGGGLLEVFVDPGNQNVEITSSHPSWIGAWWPGILCGGILLVLASIPLFLLPKNDPDFKTRKNSRRGDRQRKRKNSEEQKPSVIHDLKDLLQNPVFFLSTLILAINSMFIVGSNTFGVKYGEAQYGLTPFIASIVFGIIALVAVCSSHLIGGFIVSKLNLQVQGIIKMCMIATAASLVCTFGFFFYCNDEDFAGGTVALTGTNTTGNLIGSCNSDCGCTTDLYAPVEGSDGVTYYSPCFAGCTGEIINGTYTNCACIINSNTTADDLFNKTKCGNATFLDSTTNDKFCINFVPFCILTALAFFTSFIIVGPNTQITLRCVKFERRQVAVCFQQILTHGLGILPGRLLTGKVIDLACIVWSTKCEQVASCKVYKRWDMAVNFFLLLVSEVTIILILYIIMFFVYKPEKKYKPNNLNGHDNYANTIA